ncbi:MULTISPECIES: hypothetical protein [unclassified Xanthomonas]|uniref:hypothetical protein n=1 Tax=Xanthomonas sp. LMG 8992 TaxID=1591157 RepID=UPI00136EA6BF|nr:hypothetical protein [Xanthomonas sp. LMG 8992]
MRKIYFSGCILVIATLAVAIWVFGWNTSGSEVFNSTGVLTKKHQGYNAQNPSAVSSDLSSPIPSDNSSGGIKTTRLEVGQADSKKFGGEVALLAGNSISLGKAKVILDRKNFPAFLKEIASKSVSDPEAQELRKIYSSTIDKAAGERQGISRIEFECGVTLCVGSFDVSERYNSPDLVSDVLGRSNPVYGLLETSDAADDVVEKRFVFSVDPKVKSISSNWLEGN